MAFETSLKGFEAKISKMIISKMYDYIKIYDKNTHLWYITQWRKDLYILQEDEHMEDSESPIKAYTDEINYDIIFKILW